jgi:hypothetical protein
MKLQGLQFLEKQFAFQADQMVHILLYKNHEPEQLTQRTLGLGMWILAARECRDIAWNLGMIRDICEQGDTAPEEYDPYYDAIQDADLDPTENEPVPYDPYREMGVYLHDAHAPNGLHLKVSSNVASGAEILLQAPRKQHECEVEMGCRPMQRNVGNPEGPFRPMTDEEHTLYTRRQETAFMEASAFLLDFNSEMERLGELVLSRAPFADILELIGPEPVAAEAPF